MSAKAHFAFGVSLEIFIHTNETAKCISIDFSRLKIDEVNPTTPQTPLRRERLWIFFLNH